MQDAGPAPTSQKSGKAGGGQAVSEGKKRFEVKKVYTSLASSMGQNAI